MHMLSSQQMTTIMLRHLVGKLTEKRLAFLSVDLGVAASENTATSILFYVRTIYPALI